ncbi:MAG: LLM class F420-dependent oxidoreductase [Nostocoides sp.]
MKLGTQVSYFSWPGGPAMIGPIFGRIATNSDQAGLASLWVMDHFFQISTIGPPELDMLEGYGALAYAAGRTERIQLGTMVTGVTYRHPGLLAKTVTTLDVLSGGRAILGIGAAWNEQEHRGLGVPFAPVGERFERLEETLQICRQMFDGNESPFVGVHYQLERPLNSPQPLRRLPILVGGGGEKKTLRLVAQYADACNIFDMGPERVKAKYDVIRAHCETVGRDYAEIEKTVLTRFALSRTPGSSPSGEPYSSVDQIVERLSGLAAIGTDTVIAGMANNADDAAYELVAEVVRQVEGIVPAGR